MVLAIAAAPAACNRAGFTASTDDAFAASRDASAFSADTVFADSAAAAFGAPADAASGSAAAARTETPPEDQHEVFRGFQVLRVSVTSDRTVNLLRQLQDVPGEV